MNVKTAPTGTYFGKTVPNEVPFVGATLSLGAQSVAVRVADPRIHYTHLEKLVDEDGVICEEAKTFGGPRSVTGGWSSRIQRRFFLTVRQYDLSKIKNSPHPLALIVCKFPKTVRTNRELAAKAQEKMIAAIKYKLGKMKAYPLVWNWEFHWDGNVHFNFLMAFPSDLYAWLLAKWSKIAGHAADAIAEEVLDVTRFADFDEAGNELSFEDQFYNAASYMAGLGELLGKVKAHQYNVPEDWTPAGVGSGRMWGVRGLDRARVATYPIENLAQKKAIEAFMAPLCKQKLVEYWDPETGEVTVFNDGAFSPTRRAGSIQCLDVTEEMHEEIMDLLELHAAGEIAVEVPPAPWELDDFDALAFTTWLGEAESDDQDDREVLEPVEDVRPLSELLELCGFTAEEQRAAERTAKRQARNWERKNRASVDTEDRY